MERYYKSRRVVGQTGYWMVWIVPKKGEDVPYDNIWLDRKKCAELVNRLNKAEFQRSGIARERGG